MASQRSVRSAYLLSVLAALGLVALLFLNRAGPSPKGADPPPFAQPSEARDPPSAPALAGSAPKPTVEDLRIRVESGDGRGIPGVRGVVASQASMVLTPAEAKAAVESDADGIARFAAGEPTDLLLFDKDGYRAVVVRRSALPGPDDHGLRRIRMEAGKSLEVLVVDPSGAAVPGARVEVRGRNALPFSNLANAGSRAVGNLRSGVTGPDGRVTVRGIATFPVLVSARKTGHVPVRDVPEMPVVGPDDPVRRVLNPLHRAALAVRDQQTGRPIPTAAVRCGESPSFALAGSDRSGRWDADHAINETLWLPRGGGEAAATPEHVVFSVSAIGYRTKDVRVTPAPVDGGASLDPAPVRLERDPELGEFGNVTVLVNCAPAPTPRSWPFEVGYTPEGGAPKLEKRVEIPLDESGRCELRVPVGEYRFAALGDWNPTAEARTTVRASGTAEVRIVLSCARLRVRVVDERGGALPGYFATMSLPPAGKATSITQYVSGESFATGEIDGHERSDRSPGMLDLLVRPGRHSITFSHAGYEDRNEVLVITPGEDHQIQVRLVEKP